MCKIAVFTNANKLDVKTTVNRAGNILLKSERDGFGYAVQGVSGVYGEKCVDTSFISRIDYKFEIPQSVIIQKYSKFGIKSKPSGPLIMHGRISTNDKGLLNCHPMIRDNHYLIHNGVVSDDGPEYVKQTTNDSEDLLYRFIEGINSVEDNLTGYYAFACIDPNGNLHIVRDSVASLYITWLDKYDTYLIGTTVDLLESIAKSIGCEIEMIEEVRKDIYMVFKGNELTYINEISPRGWNYNQSKYSESSLGKLIDSYSSQSTNKITTVDQWNDTAKWSSHHRNNITDIDLDDAEYYAEEKFFEAIDQRLDDTCTIWDKHGNEITMHQFDNLTIEQQKMCLIETSDGEYIQYFIGNEKVS